MIKPIRGKPDMEKGEVTVSVIMDESDILDVLTAVGAIPQGRTPKNTAVILQEHTGLVVVRYRESILPDPPWRKTENP